MMNHTANYDRRPNTGTPKFEADPINSTYRWELYLTPGQARNTVGLLDGYSKGMGYENTNQVQLLYRKLVNPLLPYLSRCDTIIVYRQVHGLPKEFHTKLLELYRHDFKTFDWVAEDRFLNNFLHNYYEEYVQKGTMPALEDRRKNARKSVLMAELDHTKYQFKSLAELQDFCDRMSYKYSQTCMLGWYHSHAQFQPELFESDITDAVAHAVHQAATLEEAQSARSALNSFYNQHPSQRR